MISTASIYLSYYVLIDCCMPTCTCKHDKLSKMLFFLKQILNFKTSFFLRREYVCKRLKEIVVTTLTHNEPILPPF
jgi:hypothetical protein